MNHLIPLLDKLTHPKILVIGDLMLDRYTWGNADRVSPEAPVLVLKADQCEARLGGAASVALMLKCLDAQVSVAGVIGDDPEGHTLKALFDDAGIDRAGVCCARIVPRPPRNASLAAPPSVTHIKSSESITSGVRPLNASVEQQLAEFLIDTVNSYDVLLISDYAKGVCTSTLLSRVLDTTRRSRIPVLVDPARIADYSRYREATLLAPNRTEAELATGMKINTPEDARAVARRLHEQVNVKTVIVKLDRDGMFMTQAGNLGRFFPTQARDVYDATGAGDMVLAMLGLCRGSGLYWGEAVELANVAAGLEVERLGVVPINRADLYQSLQRPRPSNRQKRVSLPEMAQLAEGYRCENKKVVFTNGCMDLLHLGHVTYLLEAAEMGDVLVVAINSDDSVRKLKGEGRPVMNQEERATLVSALECVDHVLVFDDDTPHELLRIIRPDVLVKGGTTAEIAGREIVEGYGGRVVRAGKVPGYSTTGIIEQINGQTPSIPVCK